MKIAAIAHSAHSFVRFRAALVEGMVQRGHEVTVMAPDHDHDTRQRLRALGVAAEDFRMLRTGTSPIQDVATLLDLRRMLVKLAPDVTFATAMKPVIYGSLAARLAGVEHRYGLMAGLGFAFTVTSRQSLRKQVIQEIVVMLSRLAGGQLHKLMFQNPQDLEEYVARGLISHQKTAMVGATGLDLAEWRSAPFPDTPTTFILVARLLEDKGIRDYVAAIRLLRHEYPGARFLLVGGLDSNPAAIPRSEAEAWVAEGLVEWPGHDAVKPWLEKAHVFVLPSYREGVPRSTQEAMALGRPVITTDVPGCRETVNDGQNGFLVPPRNPEALAAACRRFLDSPGLIASMGRESRILAERRFDIHEQAAKYLACMNL